MNKKKANKKKKKTKLSFTLFMSSIMGVGILGLVPFTFIAINNKNSFKYETVPIFLDNASISGDVSDIISNNWTKSEIENKIKDILNANKEIVLKNFNRLNRKILNSIEILPTISNSDWTNENWGYLEFNDWKKDSNTTIDTLKWNGFGKYNATDKIVVTSKDKFKKLLSNNLSDILSKIPNSNMDNTKARLANCKILISNSNSILIGIEDTKTKKILEIPSNIIVLKPTLTLKGTYKNLNGKVNSNITPMNNVSFEYTIENKKIVNSYFKDINNDEISLLDKQVNDDTIFEIDNYLYKNVSDLDILKSLDWVDTTKEIYFSNHKEGLEIKSYLLNEEKVLSSLNIDQKNEKLIGIKFSMKTRHVEDYKFDGRYNIEVRTMSKTENNNWNTKNYKILSSHSDSELQLLVPNAYIIESFDENTEKYIEIKSGTDGILNQPIELKSGKPDNFVETDENKWNDDKIVKANFKENGFFDNFLSKIEEGLKIKNLSYYNGITFSFGNNLYESKFVNTPDFTQKFILNIALKKGITFKKEFIYKGKNFNTINQTNCFVFKTKIESSKTGECVGAFYKNAGSKPVYN